MSAKPQTDQANEGSNNQGANNSPANDPSSDLEQQLQATARLEPTVKAWTVRLSDDEIRQAVAASVKGGPLAGWTLGVKDVIDTENFVTERGSPIYVGNQPHNDAACVAMARRAGATVVGKTVTTEFALFNPNITTNPHDATRTPGGSSSGSAAAVAAGMVRAAFGTQTVGSVLRPAAYCGVVGFKPTHQLVPLTGVATLAQSLDTVGWLTRSVADTKAMLDAMSGPNPDSFIPSDLTSGNGRVRIGRYRSHQWSEADDTAADLLADAGAALASSTTAGPIEIVDLDPLPYLESVFDLADTVLHYESARAFTWEREHHFEQISRLVQKMLHRADGISLHDYSRAQVALEEVRRDHDRYLAEQSLDAILTLAAPGEAPPMKTTGDSVFNRTWTALGVPAIHIPFTTGPRGLPLGVQLAGRRWHDQELLALAGRTESAFAGSNRSAT